MSLISIHEYTFSINEFNEPAVLEGGHAIATLLARLLLLVPGTIQSHPDMGVGLIHKYRFATEDNINELKNEFAQQINKYLPQFQGAVDVFVTLNNKVLYIGAKIDGTIYNFLYDSNNNEFKSAFRTLSDL